VNPERFRTGFRLFYDETNVAYISAQLASFNKTVYVLYYEELKQDPIGELRKLLAFPPLADIRPTNFEGRLQCLSAQLTGLAKRKHQPLTFDPFTDAMKRKINGYIASTRKNLKKLGFTTLPDYERPVEAQSTASHNTAVQGTGA